MGFVSQTIQKSGRQDRIAKYLRPVRKSQVGGDEYGTPFVAFGQHLKKQFRSFFGKRDIAQLVQNQQVVTGVLLDDALQRLLLSGFDQLIDQAAAGDKTGAEVVFAGFDAQGGSQMSLPRAAIPRKITLRRSRM